mgnify:CR=1 FL=1
MVLIIDDRTNRIPDSIKNLGTSEYVTLFSEEEVQVFQEQLKKNTIEFEEKFKIIVAHATTLFNISEENSVIQLHKMLINYCFANNKIIIFFSGGNSLTSTVIANKYYKISANSFYQKIEKYLSTEDKIDIKPNINKFLFGEDEFILSELLKLRRKIKKLPNELLTGDIITNLYSDAEALNSLGLDNISEKIEQFLDEDLEQQDLEHVINTEINKYG